MDSTKANFLTGLRNNKLALLGGMGAAGGFAGSLVSEILSPGENKVQQWFSNLSTGWVLILQVAIWFALINIILCFFLFGALDLYSRRAGVPVNKLTTALIAGLIAGGVGGGVAQALYNVNLDIALKNYVLRTLCWGLAGGLAGWRLAKVIPNLGSSRGLLGGGVGGIVGCVAFLITGAFAHDATSRLIGISLYGAALGLSLVATELFFREATLEVTWAPNEVTAYSIGQTPIYVGGGDDHIFVQGLQQHAASIALVGGKIQFTDFKTNKTVELRDGSRISIGRLQFLIKAGEARASQK